MASPGSPADHAFGLLVAFGRQIALAGLSVRSGGWNWSVGGVRRLRGRRMAIIGLGSVGRDLVHRGLTFGSQVVAYSRQVLGRLEAPARCVVRGRGG